MPTPESNKSGQPSANDASKNTRRTKLGSRFNMRSGESTSGISGSGGTSSRRKEQPPKRISRRERDEQKTRIFYAVLGAAGILMAVVLIWVAANNYYFIPNKTLATVNGQDIKRKDYWKYHANTLVNQISQYQQYANFFQGDQQQQYLAMAQQASAQLTNVWGSTSTDSTTLNQMIDDRLYMDGLSSLGLSITDQDVTDFIDNRFANQDNPLFTPTPVATLIPERVGWATGTAESISAEQTAAAGEALGSPESDGTPISAATELSSPVAVEGTIPVNIENATVVGSPIAVASVGTPEPEPTIAFSEAEIRQTAAANFTTYTNQVFDLTHMNRDDYVRLVAKPALAREMVQGYFEQQVGQSAEQVHARHILVGTEELADKLETELQTDPGKFEELAQENSIDTATAPTGGDLGWFTKGAMVAPFEEVAFALSPGEISEPVQTQFGWHIIQTLAHEDDRALTDDQINQVVTSDTDRWLETQREESKISSPFKPTPTPAVQQFVPPPDAPNAPESSPIAAAATESASPIAAN